MRSRGGRSCWTPPATWHSTRRAGRGGSGTGASSTATSRRLARRPMRVLDSKEIGSLLRAAPGLGSRALLATALFTGLRQSEQLGLVWSDVGFDAGYVRVRKQLSRAGVRVEPKTEESVRDVIL